MFLLAVMQMANYAQYHNKGPIDICVDCRVYNCKGTLSNCTLYWGRKCNITCKNVLRLLKYSTI